MIVVCSWARRASSSEPLRLLPRARGQNEACECNEPPSCPNQVGETCISLFVVVAGITISSSPATVQSEATTGVGCNVNCDACGFELFKLAVSHLIKSEKFSTVRCCPKLFKLPNS